MKFTLVIVALILKINVCVAELEVKCPLHQGAYLQKIKLPQHEEGYFQVKHGTMFFQKFDQGSGPYIILAPGIPSSIYFSSLIDKLTRANYRVLSFDYPGKMNSKIHHQADANFLSRSVLSLIDAKIPAGTPLFVVGTSMGGVVAADIANAKADSVRGLVLLNPVGLHQDWTIIQKMAFVPVLNKIVAPFIMKNEIRKNISSALKCPENYENLIEEQNSSLVTWRNRWNYLNLVSNFGMIDNSSHYRLLQKLNFPILVAGGQEGMDFYVSHIEQLKKIVPRAKYITIEGTSHIPFVENPDLTFEILNNFFENKN